jgi:hypothetical protein
MNLKMRAERGSVTRSSPGIGDAPRATDPRSEMPWFMDSVHGDQAGAPWKVRLMTSICCSRVSRTKFTA